MEQHDGVRLLIHDTTELDYPGKRHSLKHLGPIGKGGRPGLLGHNTVVVEPRRRELWGLANQILVRHHRAPKGETRRAKRRRPTRERRIWKRGSEALGPVPAGRRWIDGCDRGADRFESIDHKHQQGQRYLVRSRSNRRVLVETPAGRP